jgi:hypothetical protein
MSRSYPVLPYRVLPQGVIEPATTGWAVVVNGERVAQLADGAAFPAWDAKLSFRLEREFIVKADLARELKLDAADSCCELTVSVSSAAGLVHQVLYRAEIPPGASSEQHVVIQPSSERLARDVVITSGVYLARPVESRDPLAPRAPGSRLWEISDRLRLEGGATRLPMYEVAFSEWFAGDRISRAEFHVDFVDDPELEIESALTVYLNSECPGFVAEVGRAGSAAERRLWNGIIRRAVATAMLSGDFIGEGSESAGSLASTVQRWARHIWQDVPVSKLSDLPMSSYSRFEAQIESWLDGLDSPRPPGGSK